MASNFNRNISFQEAIQSSSTIVVRGVIDKVISEKTEKYEKASMTFRQYQISVKSVLYGECKSKEILIKTVEHENLKDMAIILEPEKEMIFVLSKDFSKNQPENQYTITSRNYFEVIESGIYLPDVEANKKSNTSKRISLDDLKRQIDTISQPRKMKIPPSESRFSQKIAALKNSNKRDSKPMGINEDVKPIDSTVNHSQ